VEQTFRLVLPLFLISLGQKKPKYPHLLPNASKVELCDFRSRSYPLTIDELLQRVHLSLESTEGRMIRGVYEASIRSDNLSLSFRQLILKGPPGTGKTLIAQYLAELLARKPENLVQVQFHPSYAYEDFVGGIRPVRSLSGESHSFRFESGVFKRLCDRALLQPHENFVMVIDEINRGNVSAIFGELLWALEYRDQSLTLPFTENGQSIHFCVPKNVFVIGTMNSADRSIALMDYAFRRRFKFISIGPNVDVLDQLLGNMDEQWKGKVKQIFQLLNKKLAEVNPDLCIGHSYFRPWPGVEFTSETLEMIWELSILPLITEYFYAEACSDQFSLKTLRRELD
jgi:5-methylcytosine-specific restriction protein B